MRKIILTAIILAFFILTAQPATAGLYDLTSSNKVSIYDAWFYTSDWRATGTGKMDSFVRLIDGSGAIEEGYNTSYRQKHKTDPNFPQFQENSSPQHTHSLLLSDIPIVTIGNATYLEFLLDINQIGKNDPKEGSLSSSLLSLDALKIYQSNDGELNSYPTGWGNPIYDLDEETDNWIVLDADFNTGSGSGDMIAYIPTSILNNGFSYIYLYSKFGIHYPNNDGFEEWGIWNGTGAIPVPGAVLLGLIGMAVAGAKLRKYT